MKLGSSDPRSRVKTDGTDRAVSPVIGVILMVAITVILAAVIGVFVLGLGDELGDAAPSNSISVEGDYEWNTDSFDNLDVTVSHDTGDSVDPEDVDVVLRVDGSAEDRIGLDEIDTEMESFAVGDTVSINHTDHFAGTDYETGSPVEIQLIHNPSDSIIASGEIDES